VFPNPGDSLRLTTGVPVNTITYFSVDGFLSRKNSYERNRQCDHKHHHYSDKAYQYFQQFFYRLHLHTPGFCHNGVLFEKFQSGGFVNAVERAGKIDALTAQKFF
jgi:hypothetical protein